MARRSTIRDGKETVPMRKGIGPLEVQVLRALSTASHPVTVRQVCDILNRQGYFAYQGVLNCLNRLAAKGLLKRTRRGNTGVYALAVELDALAAQFAANMIGANREGLDRVVCRLLEIDPDLGVEQIAGFRQRVRSMGDGEKKGKR